MAYSVPGTYELNEPVFQLLDEASSTAKHDLGTVRKSADGRKFKYSYVSTNMTAVSAAGYPAFFLTGENTKGQQITSSHQSDLGASFAGLFTAALAAGGNYVWRQTSGYAPSTLLCTATTAGAALAAHAVGLLEPIRAAVISSNIATYTYSAMNVPIVGVAMEADSSGLGDVMLFDRG
jgi:hypothetical protein